MTTVPMSLGFLRGQVTYMREHGFDVHAVSSPGPELEAFGHREGIPVHGVQMHRAITPVHDALSLSELIGLFWRLRPDVVHAHTPKGGLLGMIAAATSGVAARIYHMRGLPLMTATGVQRQVLGTAERVSCSLAHQVLCVSPSLREYALEERLCAAERIRVIGGGSGNGVDADGRFNPANVGAHNRQEVRERWGLPPGAVVFGFVGRIVRDKGVAELAEAWATVRRNLPDAFLLIVGPREARDAVAEDVLRTLEADHHVRFTGARSDLPELYNAMDVVVLPTYREGFPNVPLEAAAMERPVVATRIPGCVDAVAEDLTGTLVPVRDSRALAAAMLRYGRDEDLRRRHGAAGRARVLREFGQMAIWDGIRSFYEELIEHRKRVSPRTV